MAGISQGKPRVRRQAGRARIAADAGKSRTIAYEGGDTGGDVLRHWNASMGRSADAEISWSRDQINARARDLERNNGWARGAVTKEVDAVIGATFRPLLKPDWHALGLSEEWARTWRKDVQSLWRAYADDPRCYSDSTRQQSMSQLMGTAYRHGVLEGDAIGVLQWKEDRPSATCLRIVSPELLCNPQDTADRVDLRSGIEIDRDGAAIAYHFRQGHRGDPWADLKQFAWKRIVRETEWGRPIVIHWFDKKGDGQSRGVSHFAPIIEKLKMEDRLGKAELEATLLNSIMAAFIKSPFDPALLADAINPDGGDQIGAYQDLRQEYAKSHPITLGGAQITRLMAGEELEFATAQRPSSGYAAFEEAVLRHISSGLGISYEQLASDWSKVNYSSARAALIEIWRGWNGRRQSFAQRFAQPVLMAAIEEWVDDGRLSLPNGAPDFRENWFAYTRAKWVGPGKGFVDPVKEVQAAAMRIALGLSTMEDEAAELTGSDLTDNLAQITQEIDQLPDGMLHPAQESFAKLIGHNGGPPIEDDRPRQD